MGKEICVQSQVPAARVRIFALLACKRMLIGFSHRIRPVWCGSLLSWWLRHPIFSLSELLRTCTRMQKHRLPIDFVGWNHSKYKISRGCIKGQLGLTRDTFAQTRQQRCHLDPSRRRSKCIWHTSFQLTLCMVWEGQRHYEDKSRCRCCLSICPLLGRTRRDRF